MGLSSRVVASTSFELSLFLLITNLHLLLQNCPEVLASHSILVARFVFFNAGDVEPCCWNKYENEKLNARG